MLRPPLALIWDEFSTLVKGEGIPYSKVRPYYQSLNEPLIAALSKLACRGFFNQCDLPVEVFQVENQVHFLCTEDPERSRETFCFSFVIAEGDWFFQHLENITIRLDKIGELPASSFPDLPEKQKAWIRQEFQTTEMIRLFTSLRQEKGDESALTWFKDGAGYALAARSWVPFVPPHKAFILYACWEQANLYGNQVTLLNLDDHSAQVELDSIYFQLYDSTSHLKQQIGYDDYRRLFEIIWQDRATMAGWQLHIRYDRSLCRLIFTKDR